MTVLVGVLMVGLASCGGDQEDDSSSGSEPGGGPNATLERPPAGSEDDVLGEPEPLCDEVFSRDQVEAALGGATAAPTGDLGFGLGLGYCDWVGEDGVSGLHFEASSTNNDCTSGEAGAETSDIVGLGERAVWSFDELGGQLTVCAFYDVDFSVGAELTLSLVAEADEGALRASAEELGAAGLSWLDRNEFGPNQH